jgi:hypothetical protein
MPTSRHCRHCYGDCGGACLLPGDQGLCIHSPAPRRGMRSWLSLMGTRSFWRRLLTGKQ